MKMIIREKIGEEEKERGTRGCRTTFICPRTGWMVGHIMVLGILDATLNATCLICEFNRGVKHHLDAEVLCKSEYRIKVKFSLLSPYCFFIYYRGSNNAATLPTLCCLNVYL